MSQLAVPHQPQQPRELTEVKNRANAFFKPRKKSLTSGFSLNSAAHPNSHIIMTNNAMFLLGNFFKSSLPFKNNKKFLEYLQKQNSNFLQKN